MRVASLLPSATEIVCERRWDEATPPTTYFLLACVDAGNTLVETDETNSCKESSSTVTVTP
jgi:hypothetical protein